MGAVAAKIHAGNQKVKTFDPDEKWSNLYREREKNHIYRWVGAKNGGDLLSIYEKDGEEGVNRFAEEKIAPLLYDEGLNGAHTIKVVDYLKWKRAMNLELGVTEGEERSYQAMFTEHKALWRLNKRGTEGENVVHLLLDREQPTCHEIARILLKKYPGLSDDVCLGNDWFGQSALHLAIVNDDSETVQLLLENGADVNPRARGDFFLPEGWRNSKKIADYKGWAYYGEYPLAFAACFGNKDIYDLLIEYGADPNLQDSFGNTILHMCVISNSISMYSYAVKHWNAPADPDIVNDAGYTPITLATKLGRKKIFEQMLELSKIEFWRFSDMTCSAYPLSTLDTIRPDGTTNYDSALMTVINGSSPDHLDMIESEVLQRLLADKWTAFARNGLYWRMVQCLCHLICLSIACGIRPTELGRLYFDTNFTKYEGNLYDKSAKWDDGVRLVLEILTYLFTMYYYYQQITEMKAQGVTAYFRNLSTTPAKVVYTFANFLILLCLPCRICRWYEVEESLLAFAVPCSFIYLLFFARVFKLTGPFVQMIYSMIAGDLALFAIISTIFVVPFSFVFYFLGADMEAKQTLYLPYQNDETLPPHVEKYGCKVSGYTIFTFDTRFETFITLFRASMGGYDYEELDCANYELFTKLLFVLYMFVMPIMMINILIAMMGNTYTTVIAKAEKAWRRQYAQSIMNLERSLNKETLVKHMIGYSIELQKINLNGDAESRGLMVVKRTEKTRASARRHATQNWIRLGRKVVQTVERVGFEHALHLLHGHDRMKGLIEQDMRRPVTRSNRPATVWKKGAAEIVRFGNSPRDDPNTLSVAEPIAPPPRNSSTVTPSGVVIDVTALAGIPTATPRLVRVRGSVTFPGDNLPNMPTGSAPTRKKPVASRDNSTRTA